MWPICFTVLIGSKASHRSRYTNMVHFMADLWLNGPCRPRQLRILAGQSLLNLNLRLLHPMYCFNPTQELRPLPWSFVNLRKPQINPILALVSKNGSGQYQMTHWPDTALCLNTNATHIFVCVLPFHEPLFLNARFITRDSTITHPSVSSLFNLQVP